MHWSNHLFWRLCKQKYNTYFKGSSVIEFGSADINGTVKDYFEDCEKYIGVDWRQDKGVDLVSFAHELNLEEEFDVVISASMLEHDPHWEKSITNMLHHLKDDGILFLSWGAALNPIHECYTAPDGGFHPLLAGKVLNLLKKENMYVHEFKYEGLLEGYDNAKRINLANGMGEVCLVAFTDKKYALGEPQVDDLIKEDRL